MDEALRLAHAYVDGEIVRSRPPAGLHQIKLARALLAAERFHDAVCDCGSFSDHLQELEEQP